MTRAMTKTSIPLALVALTQLGCATTTGTFKDQPIVWRVDDTQDIAPVHPREFLVHQYAADIIALRRTTRAMELRSTTPARNTNALDEVPDSTWFTNRIGVRAVKQEEAARGSSAGGPPRLPLVLIEAKSGGTNPGFVAKDAAGRKFVVKFDPMGSLELQTAASVIVNRFFWTIGFNVPSDDVFSFKRSDITVAPDAHAGTRGHPPFTEAMLDQILTAVPRLADGSYRASSSELLNGKPVGGFAAEGVRSDDKNDRVPHEHRRELRGLRVFAAWLDHTDMKEDNGLDVYVEEDGRHFLRHYLIDFGEALGGHAAEKGRMADGFDYAWDTESQLKATFAFGLWKRPWEDRKPSPWPSIGSIATDDFDPVHWREAYPYWPFFERDAADEYWAAKIVMRFDRPLIEALVATGRLGDPGAAAYLANALAIRRHKIGMAFIEAVTALDELAVSNGHLCGRDLGTYYGLAHGGVVERLDDRSRVVESAVIARDGSVCLGKTAGGYQVLRLRISRGAGVVRPPMRVHVKDAARVVGIQRIEP
jgi:hypothetical protein